MDEEKNEVSYNEQQTVTLNPFVLTCSAFPVGKAAEFAASLSDKNKKLICDAELLYYTGHPDQAYALVENVNEADEITTTLGIYLINALTAMTMGNVNQVTDIFDFIKSIREFTDIIPDVRKTVEFFTLYFQIMIHNTESIVFPPQSVNAFAVPDELKPIAIYAYAHYLITTGDYDRATGLCEGAMIMMKDKSPISEIYLSLIASIGNISRGSFDRAEYYFRYAWSLAFPDGIIMPFVEFRWMLSGLLEKCIRYEYPEEYKAISELSLKYHKNWVYVHNFITGDTVSDKLTAIEFNVAMLASMNLSNVEIADFLEISVNSVRAHLRNIFNKLGIFSRKELNKYVIK